MATEHRYLYVGPSNARTSTSSYIGSAYICVAAFGGAVGQAASSYADSVYGMDRGATIYRHTISAI